MGTEGVKQRGKRVSSRLACVWALLTAIIFIVLRTLVQPSSPGAAPLPAEEALAATDPPVAHATPGDAVQRHEPEAGGASCSQRTAVVLQAYRLTECLVSQVEQMHRQLRPSGTDFFLLFDDTHGGFDAARIGAIGVRASTWQREQMEVYHQLGRDGFDNAYEKLALLLWSAAHPEYEHVWLIEDDVTFSGDWRALIDAHCGRAEDMLGAELDAEATKKLTPWLWKRCSFCTPQTREEVALLLLPAARFSRRLLAEAARFEIFFPTLCHRRAWCSSGLIAPTLLGTYRYRPCVSRLGRHGRLYHPVKLDNTCQPKAQCQQKPPTNPIIPQVQHRSGSQGSTDDTW